MTILTVGCSCFFIIGVIAQSSSLAIGLIDNSNRMLLSKEAVLRVVELVVSFSILFCLNYRLTHHRNNVSGSSVSREGGSFSGDQRKYSRDSKSKTKLELAVQLDAEKAIQIINSN